MILDNKKVIALIGARGGSKRIPKKNLKLLGGRPLIHYSITIAKQLGFPCYVSSDSSDILSVAKELGAIACLRKYEHAQNDSTDYDWIRGFLDDFSNSKKYIPDIIIFLRPTSPMRCPEKIQEAIAQFKDENSSLRSVEPLSEAIEKTFKIKDDILTSVHNSIPLKVTNYPNDFFLPSYKGNGYVDILKTETIYVDGDIYGDRIQAFITPNIVELDTENEWGYLEYLIKMFKNKQRKNFNM